MGKTPLLTGFLISIVLFSFFIGVFGLYFSAFSSEYGVSYDNDTLEQFNKMEEMRANVESYRDEVSDTDVPQNFIEKGVDAIGGLVTSGINTVKIIFGSFELFSGMVDTAESELNQVGFGSVISTLKVTVVTISLILLFVGLLLPIILRRIRL